MTDSNSLLTDKNSIFIGLIFILFTVSCLHSVFLFLKNPPPAKRGIFAQLLGFCYGL
jgi:hypothetical protein